LKNLNALEKDLAKKKPCIISYKKRFTITKGGNFKKMNVKKTKCK
jgi:hypothetical protein